MIGKPGTYSLLRDLQRCIQRQQPPASTSGQQGPCEDWRGLVAARSGTYLGASTSHYHSFPREQMNFCQGVWFKGSEKRQLLNGCYTGRDYASVGFFWRAPDCGSSTDRIVSGIVCRERYQVSAQVSTQAVSDTVCALVAWVCVWVEESQSMSSNSYTWEEHWPTNKVMQR